MKLKIPFFLLLHLLLVSVVHAQNQYGKFDSATGAVTFTGDAEVVKAKFLKQLNDTKASVSEVFIWASPDNSKFVLTGRVQNSSNKTNLIGLELQNNGGSLVASGPGTVFRCKGEPCNSCDWVLSGWRIQCKCYEPNCNNCRCNLEIEINITLW
jgi:hypothetical protein